MANANPVNAYDMTLLAASESTFDTYTQPLAAQALEVINANLGPSSGVGQVRPKKDRPTGRGMQNEFITGDVDPFPFVVEYSQKSRAAIDSNAKDLVFMKAAGLTHTVNAATSTVLSLGATPIESGAFASCQLIRYLGHGADGLHQAEVLRGGVVKEIIWSGGDKEMNVKVSGAGVRKTHIGRLDSVTFANGSVSTYTPSTSDFRKVGEWGDMQIESEVVQITKTVGSTDFNVNRAIYSSSGVAHTAKPMYPYMPPSITYTGSPISEATASCILGSISPMRIMNWEVAFTTGLDHLPAETSSAYRQGAKSLRYDLKVKLKMVLSVDRVDLLGYALVRDNLSLTLSQGTGTGGIWSLTAPYCEVVAFSAPDTAGEIAIVDVELRCRENSTGNNAFSITLT